MIQVEGIARSVRLEREGGEAVLRFVLEPTGSAERIPVEMRGRRVKGVLTDGDRVNISAGRLRDRDGVARPRVVQNLSTTSVIRVESRGCLHTALSFIGSLVASVLAGWLSTLLVGMLTLQEPGIIAYSLEEPGAPIEEAASGAPWLLVVGFVVAAAVFLLLFVLPLLRRARS
ncbi:MAG: hypothetical protein Kow00124_21590 [Anaerolineae bacterium]